MQTLIQVENKMGLNAREIITEHKKQRLVKFLINCKQQKIVGVYLFVLQEKFK